MDDAQIENMLQEEIEVGLTGETTTSSLMVLADGQDNHGLESLTNDPALTGEPLMKYFCVGYVTI